VSASPVRRRHVFYLSGFDPKGASHYHALYREQAALQAGVSGTRYEVGPRQRCGNGNSCWRVIGDADGVRTETTFEFVRWDDIVRAQWPRRARDVLLGSVRGYRAALASFGALRKVWRVAPRTLVSLAYPALFWAGALLLVLVAGWIGWQIHSMAGASQGLAAAVALAAAAALGYGALLLERRLNTTWLLRIYQFAGDWSRDRIPALPPRLDQLAQDLEQALDDPAIDEVLLVGFSVGSLLAASAASRLHRRAEAQGRSLEKLSMVTLGHCIPLLGLMAGADAYRAELERLGRDPRIAWTDFSSVTDWGSFAGIDPLALCLGPAGQGRPHAPTMLSPRFHLMFEPAAYAHIVRNKRRMHMQYLMAGERPVLYDYFAITAGPLALRDRLARGAAP
jgi:pimeloyl-ACP methyl ester carboxylesterase